MMASAMTPIERRLGLTDRVERLRRMMEIRLVEEAVQKLFSDGEIRGSTHLCNGQEAVAVGVAAATRPDDAVTCTYRGHGHALALGMTAQTLLGELCGRSTGCAGGIGGSMHLVDPEIGLFPTFAIIGAGLPVACGAALAALVNETDQVAVAIFGDGASNIGAFHESLNFAAVKRLPVVFVCENNLYGEYSHIEFTTPISDIASRADSYGMPGVIVDGQDVDSVMDATSSAVLRARQGLGPTLLEMKTYRYSGHSRSDPATYRPAGELDEWLTRDPIELLSAKLVDENLLTTQSVQEVKQSMVELVDAAVAKALDDSQPDVSEILSHVFEQ